jgi:hypothetical protein
VAAGEEPDLDLDLAVEVRAECQEAVALVPAASARVEDPEQLVTQAVCGKAAEVARALVVDWELVAPVAAGRAAELVELVGLAEAVARVLAAELASAPVVQVLEAGLV